MNKKISLGITISLVAISAAITFVITMSFSLGLFNSKVSNVKEREEMYTKLGELDSYVRSYFIDEISEDDLITELARGYVTGMGDKYARYYTAEEYSDLTVAQSGYNVGIGCTVKEDGGYILIDSVMEGSAAEESGLVAGDIIVGVDEIDVLSIGYNAAVAMVAGEENTIVTLTVRRNGEDSLFYCTRRKNEIKSVYSEVIGDVGYVKITDFNSITFSQFQVAVDTVVNAGAKGIVFDLRNTGGGLLSAVNEMIDYLVPEGDIVVTNDKNGLKTISLTSDEHEIDLPMVVVVNGNTASASELFTAAVRDFKGAKLIGENTFGKGVVQEIFKCADGSAIKFTTATYQTTKSDVFDGVGLKPDFEVFLADPTLGIYPNIELEADAQLKKAIEVIGTAN